MRGKPLVDQSRGEMKAASESLRKAPREASQFVFRPVGVRRNADDKLDRLPFLYQGGNRRKPGAIVLAANGGEGMRDAYRQIADRNPDAFFTEVERQDGAGAWSEEQGVRRQSTCELGAFAPLSSFLSLFAFPLSPHTLPVFQAWPACSERRA